MPRDVSPIGPNNNGPSPRSFNQDGAIGDRKGGGQRKGREKEPEPVEEEEGEEEARLDNDNFAGAKNRNDLTHFLDDLLPWEQAEEERKRRLEEIKKKRAGQGKSGPLGSGRLGDGLKGPVLPPRALGRQVEGGHDASGAVYNTYRAHMSVRERQAELARAREAEQQAQQKPPTGPLATPGAPVAGARPVSEPPRPAARPQPSAASAAPSWPVPLDQEPPAKAKAARPAEPAERGPAAPTRRPQPEPKPAVAQEKPAQPEKALPGEPEARTVVEKVVPAAPEFKVFFRVVDAQTGHTIPGARLELEPLDDDLLPLVNGQTDSRGQYRSNQVPAGRYQLAIRYPGYIPYTQAVLIADGASLSLDIGLVQPGR